MSNENTKAVGIEEQIKNHIIACQDVGWVVLPEGCELDEDTTSDYCYSLVQTGVPYKFTGAFYVGGGAYFGISGAFGRDNDGYDTTELTEFIAEDILQFQPISGQMLQDVVEYSAAVESCQQTVKTVNDLSKKLKLGLRCVLLSDASDIAIWESSRC